MEISTNREFKGHNKAKDATKGSRQMRQWNEKLDIKWVDHGHALSLNKVTHVRVYQDKWNDTRTSGRLNIVTHGWVMYHVYAIDTSHTHTQRGVCMMCTMLYI